MYRSLWAVSVTDHASTLFRILRVLCSNLHLSGDFDFRALAKATPGYVGADLASLTGAAGVIAVKRMFKEMGRRDGGGTPQIVAIEEPTPQLSVGWTSNGDEPTEAGELMVVDGVDDLVAVPAALEFILEPQPTEGESQLPSSADRTAPTSPELLSRPLALEALFSTLPRKLLRTPIASFLVRHPQPLADPILASLSLRPSDFSTALLTLQPSSKREGFATVPDVTWSDIGALHSTRDELHMAIVQPIRRPELFKRVGITAPGGVLLWGPPGCGKTLLAKAVANESRANFISVKGPELLNKVRAARLFRVLYELRG